MFDRGFTLLELVVSLAIIVSILGAVLFSFFQLTQRTTLNTLVQDIALLIREAQVSGIAVREHGAGTEDFPPYGVNFGAPPVTEFTFYADTHTQGTGKNTFSKPEEEVETLRLERGYAISALYGCSGGSCLNLASGLDILFIRPDPEAIFNPGPYESVEVELSAPQGGAPPRTITIHANGQISTE